MDARPITIDESDIRHSVEVLARFGAKRVWLFGSALSLPRPANDLDLACEGVPANVFYNAVAALMTEVGKPIDLVDLSVDTRQTRHIRSCGKLIYDEG